MLEGFFYSLMCGRSDSYRSALAVELGHPNSHLALLATLPSLCGAFAQSAVRP